MFSSEEYIYGTFEDCIGLFNSHYRSFLCQNLYLVVALLQWQFSKCAWATFHHELAQHNFWELIFNFLMLVVSHVSLLYVHVSTHAKNDC